MQAVAALALVGIVAGGVPLVGIERSDPDVVIDEAGSLTPPGFG